MTKDKHKLIFLYWDEPVYNWDKLNKLKIKKDGNTKNSTNWKKGFNKK
jgi:hypothetical protein